MSTTSHLFGDRVRYRVTCDRCSEKTVSQMQPLQRSRTVALSVLFTTARSLGWRCSDGRHVCGSCKHAR